ncbi:hypothetical protein SFA35_02380 [Pseudomonas sp. HR96]|uniref:hypothetical protein n=1 Tax=Pseudomonas sp. HR96 TaxID=1027966 RepID=UPI002A75B731|nr:hypothetical protein [Pseudomonas sp. HR96]WPP00260.1 hypothetical protein SFA35_02380 [Pseudomonas sp. HR96]
MKIVCVAVLAAAMLSGCSMFGGSDSACEVFSPAAVALPTTQNEQQVSTSATGDPTNSHNVQQNCGSKG